MTVSIREAQALDAAVIAAIYAPYCESSATSFEVVAPNREEFEQRIAAIGVQWPWLVVDVDGTIAGYAYAGRHQERAAYKWAVNTAVYIAEPFQRRGVGRALYTALFELLRHQGYYKACAGITLPNEASVGLHEAFGFTLVGVYRDIGYKLGAWHDVAWYEAELQPPMPEPDAPRAISAIHDALWNDAVARAVQCVKVAPHDHA